MGTAPTDPPTSHSYVYLFSHLILIKLAGFSLAILELTCYNYYVIKNDYTQRKDDDMFHLIENGLEGIEMQIHVDLQRVQTLVLEDVGPLAPVTAWRWLIEELSNGFQFFERHGHQISIREYSTITKLVRWYDVTLTESGWKIKR